MSDSPFDNPQHVEKYADRVVQMVPAYRVIHQLAAVLIDETDGKTRGMPNLNLTEDQIDQIVSYLTERK